MSTGNSCRRQPFSLERTSVSEAYTTALRSSRQLSQQTGNLEVGNQQKRSKVKDYIRKGSTKGKTPNTSDAPMENSSLAQTSWNIPWVDSIDSVPGAHCKRRMNVSVQTSINQSDAQTQTDFSVDQSQKPTRSNLNQSEKPTRSNLNQSEKPTRSNINQSETQTQTADAGDTETRSLRKRTWKIVEEFATPTKKAKASEASLKVVIKKEKEGMPVKKKRGRPRKSEHVIIENDNIEVSVTENSVVNSNVQVKKSKKADVKSKDNTKKVDKKRQIKETANKDPTQEDNLDDRFSLNPLLEQLELQNLEALEGDHENEILEEVTKVLPSKHQPKGKSKRGSSVTTVMKDENYEEEYSEPLFKEDREEKYETEKERVRERRLFKSIEEQAEKTLRLSILYCTDENPMTAMDADTILKLETRIWFISHEKLTFRGSEIYMSINGRNLDMKPYIEPVQELTQLYNTERCALFSSDRFSLAVSHPERWGNFINMQVLSQALDTVDSGVGLCNVCGWTNVRPTEVKFHLIRKHTSIKDYLCDICGEKFYDWRKLWRHKYEHLPDDKKKKYHCDKCGKTFARKEKLTRHMHVHDDIKHEMCDQCGKAFRCKNHVKRHIIAVHMNLRLHLCPLCGRSYKDRRDMKRHVLVVHNVTENSIKQSANGAYHIVDNEAKVFKIYDCMFCGVQCRDRTEMRRHLKKIHPDNIVTDKEIEASVHISDTPLLSLLPHAHNSSENTSKSENQERETTDNSTVGVHPQETYLQQEHALVSSFENQNRSSVATVSLVPAAQSNSETSVYPQQLTFTACPPTSQVSMVTEGGLTLSAGTVLRPQDTALQGSSTVPIVQYQTVQVLPEGTVAVPYQYPLDAQQIPTVAYSLQ